MKKSQTLGGLFDLDSLEEQIAENEARMAEPDFWDDGVQAQKLINENNILKNKFDNFHQKEQAIENL